MALLNAVFVFCIYLCYLYGSFTAEVENIGLYRFWRCRIAAISAKSFNFIQIFYRCLVNKQLFAMLLRLLFRIGFVIDHVDGILIFKEQVDLPEKKRMRYRVFQPPVHILQAAYKAGLKSGLRWPYALMFRAPCGRSLLV